MRFIQKASLFLLMLMATQAHSFTPESGFWWNPDESGSGYAIEIQDNYLFVALYVYDQNGNPEWYSAGTKLQGNALFDSELNYTYGGACIDCSYTQPISIPGDKGPITINFLTETTATIQFRGATKHIERFNFLLGDETDRLVGEWQAIIDFSSVEGSFPFSGDVLLFEKVTHNNGSKVAEGCRPDNSTKGFCSNYARSYHDIAAEYDYQKKELIIVVNDSKDYWLAYYLKLGLDQFDGVAQLYPKGSNPGNQNYPVRGFRTASRSFIETGVGPSKRAEKAFSEVVGIADKLQFDNLNLETKELSKEEQTKQLRRQTIVKSLIATME